MNKSPLPLVVIALGLLAVLALVFIDPELMVSPGPLAGGHAELATDCFACHRPWRGAASARCIDCHKVADIGIKTVTRTTIAAGRPRTSFHQQLIEQDCMACHSEHKESLQARRSRKPFSHALLREPVRQRCSSCHVAPKDPMHRDVRMECAQCHQSAAWKPATFDHARYFVLDQDHRAPCVTCHARNDYRGFTCYGCHEHSEAKVLAEHREQGIRNFEDCVACHRDPQIEPRGRGERH